MLVSALYGIALANTLAVDTIVVWRRGEAWAQVLTSTFGVSVAILVGVVVAVRLTLASPPRPVDRLDAVAFIAFAMLVLVPHQAMSWLAITLLAFYQLVRERRSPEAVSAASLYLAVAFAGYWATALLKTFAGVLLAWDARLMAGLLELMVTGPVERTDTIISIGDQVSLIIMVGCGSLINVAYGLLWWLAIARILTPAWHRSDVAFALAVVVSGVLMNAVRVAGMGAVPQAHEWLHNGMGSHLFNIVSLVLATLLAIASTQWIEAAHRRGFVAARRG